MDFVWDDKKAESNFKKHGVRFTEAASIWLDFNSIEIPDENYSDNEERWIRLGFSESLRVLVVVFVEKIEREQIRIISARKANKLEKKTYSERLKL